MGGIVKQRNWLDNKWVINAIEKERRKKLRERIYLNEIIQKIARKISIIN